MDMGGKQTRLLLPLDAPNQRTIRTTAWGNRTCAPAPKEDRRRVGQRPTSIIANAAPDLAERRQDATIVRWHEGGCRMPHLG